MLGIRKGILLTAIIACVTAVATGCSMDLGSEIASELGKINIDVDVDVNANKIHHETLEGSTEKDGLSEIKKVVTDISMGDIEISYEDTDRANIQYTYTISANDSTNLKDILSKIEIQTEYEDNCLTITFVEKDSGKNIWKWVEKEYKNFNLGVDMKIELPRETEACDIETGMGDIILNSFSGNIQVETGMGDLILNDVIGTVEAETSMGDITAKNITILGDCKFDTAMGDITCSFKDASEKADVSMVSNMGDININTKQLTAVADEKGDEFMSDSIELTVNSVCCINAKTDMGSVKWSD